MFNPKTGDGRITGSTASLLGLEKALDTKDTALLDEAVEKIVLLHGIVLAYGGLPLIYAGDEIGTLNDYSFLKDNTKKEDSRWVNRPHQNWEIIAGLDDATTPNSKIFRRLKKLISIRKKNKVFADNSNVRLHHSGNDHILLFERTDKKSGVLVIANFNTATEVVDASAIQKMGYIKSSAFEDMIQNKKIKVSSGFLEIAPYQLLWLKKS